MYKPLAPHYLQETVEPDGSIRLAVAGDDLSNAPALRDRLRELAAPGQRIRLDLSRVDFMDSSGMHVLIQSLADSRSDGWHLDIATNPSPAVMRLIELSGAGPHLWPTNA